MKKILVTSQFRIHKLKILETIKEFSMFKKIIVLGMFAVGSIAQAGEGCNSHQKARGVQGNCPTHEVNLLSYAHNTPKKQKPSKTQSPSKRAQDEQSLENEKTRKFLQKWHNVVQQRRNVVQQRLNVVQTLSQIEETGSQLYHRTCQTADEKFMQSTVNQEQEQTQKPDYKPFFTRPRMFFAAGVAGVATLIYWNKDEIVKQCEKYFPTVTSGVCNYVWKPLNRPVTTLFPSARIFSFGASVSSACSALFSKLRL